MKNITREEVLDWLQNNCEFPNRYKCGDYTKRCAQAWPAIQRELQIKDGKIDIGDAYVIMKPSVPFPDEWEWVGKGFIILVITDDNKGKVPNLTSEIIMECSEFIFGPEKINVDELYIISETLKTLDVSKINLVPKYDEKTTFGFKIPNIKKITFPSDPTKYLYRYTTYEIPQKLVLKNKVPKGTLTI